MHGGTYTNRVGVLTEGDTPNSYDVAVGVGSYVAAPTLNAISEQCQLVGVDVTCLNDPTIPSTGIRYVGLIGQRNGPAYTTHDQYKARLYTDTRLFRTGGKLIIGCAEGDVTDSAVDTDMPALLDLAAKSYANTWSISGIQYAPVLFRPDKQEGPWEFDYIARGGYAHVGTAGMRKKFRQGAYTDNTDIAKTFTSGNGKYDDLDQDPVQGAVMTPYAILPQGTMPPTGTVYSDGTTTPAFP